MNITSSCLKRSLSLAAGFLISVVSLFSGYPLKVPAVWADTANVLPNGQTGDTTGDSLSDVTADDATCDPDALSAVATGDTCYTVDKSVVMLLSSFDTSGIPGGSTITAAVLHFQFGAENGYSGSNPVRYNNGAGLTTTGITPTDIAGWSADQTFDLYGAGVNTLAEIGAVDIEFTSNDGGGPSAVHFDYVWITVTYTPPVNTTLGSGTDPASATAAPGSGIQDAGAFTFQTGTGTDSITALTVILAGAGTPYNGLSEVRVTSNDGATLYFAAISSPSSNTLNFSGGTAIPATTTQTAFKIRVTPKTHANMDGPPGASYDLSPYVSAFTSTNTQAGSDSNANTLTVDNFSPNEATSTGGSAADQQVTLNWTSSNSGDFDTTSGSVVYRWASGSAGAEAPDEGTTPSAGDTDGTATVACVISSAASASLSKIDGSGGSAGCTTVALTNGQQYTYKVFQRDIRGNYDGGVSIGTFTPSSAKFWLELPGQTFTDGVGVTGTATVTANESFSITVYKTDGANNLDASYTGSHTINWTWTATSSPNDNIAPTKPADGAQTFSSGSVTVSGFILTDASETPSITATEPSGPEGDSSTITVNPGSTTKLVITTNPTSTTAGVETSQYIVQRRDAVGNPTTSGTQQVDLSSTSTGGAKQLRDTSGGGGVTFVTIANGVSTENFFYYDEKSGSWTISVSATGKTGDSKALTVDPASASAFTVTTENGGTEVAGTSFSVTLTAKDSFNNTVSSGPNNYTGSHTINWTWTATNSPNDTAPTKPADGAQTFTNGVLTLAGFTLTDSGETPTITGTEPAGPAGTSAAITVQPAGVDSFMVTTESGGTETAGTAFSVTLTAKDSLGNTVSSGVNNYTGAKTINWTWTATNSPNSTAPTKPADGARTFTNGVLTLSGFTLTNAGETPTITATDPNSPNPAGTSAAITVQPGAADSFTVTTQNGGTETANISFSVTLTAKDSLGNTVSSGVNNYTGSKTINWTWTATSSPNDNVAPTKPANGAQTFTNGVLTLAGFTLMDASETPTITATDPNSPNPAGTSAAITVNLGATNKLVITTWPSSVNADTETTQYIIQRRDAVGNPTTSGTQQVDLSSNSTGTYQFRDTSGGGSVTFVTIADTASTENFFYIDNTLGSWTISISFTGLTGDSKPLEVTSDKFWLELPGQIFVDGTGVTGTATVTANGSFSITIYKTDGSNVTDTSYTGSHTIDFTSTATNSPNDDTAPTIPSSLSVTFTSGVGTTTVSFTLTDASETPTISASESGGPAGDSSAITVNPGTTTKLVITTNPVSVTAGSETTEYIIQRRDAVGNPTISGTQQVNLSSTSAGSAKQFRDTSGGGSVSFVTIGAGVSTENFFYYDEKSGSWTISVSATGKTGDSKALTVDPAPAASFTVTTENGGVEIAGTSFSVTLTAKDAYNNTVSSGANNYTGSKTINWTWTATNSPNSTAPTKPADGVRIFTNGVLTLAGFTLTDSGEAPTITATDPNSPNPVGTSAAITVRPAAADSFTVTTQNGGTETANASFSVTLTAKDSFGNTVSSGPNNYTGSKTINWTWTATSSPNDGVSPTKPSNGARTFTNGVLTLGGFILTDASETPTITGTDPNSPNPAGTSAAITVNPGSTTKLVITTNPVSVTAGSETTQYIVQRRDAVGNPTTSGGQTVNLSSTSTGSAKQFRDTSGGGGVSAVTITNGNSTENFFYYDEKSGNWTISVSATGKTGASKSLTVNPAATNSLVITTVPASTEAGSESGTFVVQRRDQFGNATTSGTQQVDLSSNSTGVFEFRDASGGAAVAFVTIGAGASIENFFYLDDTAGSWTISVSFIGLTGDSEPFTVIELAAPSGFGGAALSTTSIRWNWTDNSSTEDGFRLYSGVGGLIATLAANAVSYDETGLTLDTSYTRYVRAFKGFTESSASNSAAVKTKAPPAEEEEEEVVPPAEEEVVPPPVEAEEEEEEEVVPPAEEEVVSPPAPSLWKKFVAWTKGFRKDVAELTNALATKVVESARNLSQDSGDALFYIYNRGLSLVAELSNQVKIAVEGGLQLGQNVTAGLKKTVQSVSTVAKEGISSLLATGRSVLKAGQLGIAELQEVQIGLAQWLGAQITDGIGRAKLVADRSTAGVERVLLGLDKFREIVFETEPNHISNVRVAAISSTEVEVSWETNHLSTSQVNYGSAVGTYEFTTFSGEQTREHTMVLTGLNSGATYYYELISKNRDYAVDAFRSFTTPAK